ncbi:non-ribosomal peptide synthetase [Pedobacter steynii]|uniref:Carrier domain-containing protein n=1 Tax=Pedobacter steynii TaxID=430522 RepID=A0A1D7QJA6_9SPHI|nr:non-ribosomal peptide synthetase [Pedobacter steynii]AOM78755.1 hypothetical protein BFS30_17180 [Pedobacter steynii]
MIFQHKLIESLNRGKETIAIEYQDRKVSYAQLIADANRITKRLLDDQIPHGTYIGIILDDKADLIKAIIGIANARCVFVPIDRSWPAGRLEAIKTNLKLSHIITSGSLVESRISVSNIYHLEDLIGESVPTETSSLIYPGFEEEDSLYIYFTSGSTGIPKAIIGKNSSLTQFLNWEAEEFEIDNSFRVSQLISPYFDAFLRDVFLPLFTGGVLCIPPDHEDFFTPERMFDWLEQSNISLIHCVPSVFRLIKDHKGLREDSFKHLKYILLSGEKIVPDEFRNWYQIFKDRIQLCNLYGTTETTLIRAFYRIKPADVSKNRIPIGKPIADTELLVTNKDFKPCNVLISGELYIISDFLSKGYLNAAELTAEKFILIHSGPFEGRMAFRTGDKAKILPDGNYELLGREDRQVKLRGIRIELDEIENVLIQSALVKNAVVIKWTRSNDTEGSQDIGNQESIIAFVIKAENLAHTSSLEDKIHNYLMAILPAYMMPAGILLMTEFPLLGNGKIDHKRLAEAYELSHESILVAPVNDIERALLIIWRETLGVSEISTEDNFHKIGGNSLSMMKLIAKIYARFKVRFPLSDLFKMLTITSQATYIKNAIRNELFEIKKAPEKETYYLSSAQERLYFLYELHKQSTAYNLPVAFEITGKADTDKIQQTFIALIERHEILRTKFVTGLDTVYQEIAPGLDFELENISGESIAEAIDSFIRPFDLNKGPLFRAAQLTAEGRNFLVFDIHHIACDGLSQINIFSDFLDLYADKELKPLIFRYVDYSEWEKNFRETSEYNLQKGFWTEMFSGRVPKLELPVSASLQERNEESGAQANFEIESSLISDLVTKTGTDGITAFSALHSVFFLFMTQLTGQDDLVVGTMSSGRLQQGLEPLVGMFSRTLPVRYKVDARKSFNDLVKEVNQLLIQIQSHQLYDLADILIEVNKNNGVSETQLFDVMFVYQNYDKNRLGLENTSFSYHEFEHKATKYPLSLVVSESASVFNFRMEYATRYFSPSDIERLIAEFQTLVITLSERPDTELIDLISNTEQSSEFIEDDISFNV